MKIILHRINNINELNKGGGDDGNRESLLDINLEEDENIFFKEKIIENKNDNFKNQELNLYFKPCESLKKFNFSEKKKPKNFFENKKKKDYSPFIIYYINSEFETLIKEQIWEKTNSDFANFQAIRSRIQKEKPYAFFGNKKIYFNSNK
jgi:hypothetical protein